MISLTLTYYLEKVNSRNRGLHLNLFVAHYISRVADLYGNPGILNIFGGARIFMPWIKLYSYKSESDLYSYKSES